MAKSILVALLLVALVAQQIFADSISIAEEPAEIASSPAAAYNKELLHQYSLQRLEFLLNCANKTSSTCGEEVANNMLDGSVKVSRDCCKDLLVKIGQECHMGLVQFAFSTYEYKDIASEAVPRSKQTWNMCVNMVGKEIGAAVSLEI